MYQGKLSIDRLVDLGLNSDDARIDHVPVTLHDNLNIKKIVYNCARLVMALLEAGVVLHKFIADDEIGD
jgi:hypothetical protein